MSQRKAVLVMIESLQDYIKMTPNERGTSGPAKPIFEMAYKDVLACKGIADNLGV